jgi:hypothetical protein
LHLPGRDPLGVTRPRVYLEGAETGARLTVPLDHFEPESDRRPLPGEPV